ncbi:MAG: DUF3592 domain-containing protein [Ignavibacteria bacterium]|nr:DUF3592 domain-containing protein [Ignavibacteria bacterium]
MNIITFFRDNILLATFALVGAAGLSAAGYFSYDTLIFLDNAKHANGVVSEINRHAGNSTSPVIQFRLPNGKFAEYTSKVESSTAHFTIGEEVRMLYLPSAPSESARIDDFFELWLLPIIFGGLGVVFGGIPVGMWLYDRRTSGSATSMTLQQQMDEIKRNKRTTVWNSAGTGTSQMSHKILGIFPAIGIVLLILAGIFAWKQVQFMSVAPQYRALVIANEMRGRAYYPVYEFVGSSGDTIHAYSTVGTNPALYAIGESADILYDAEDNSANARDFFIEWFAVIIVGGIGALFTGIGFILLRVFR